MICRSSLFWFVNENFSHLLGRVSSVTLASGIEPTSLEFQLAIVKIGFLITAITLYWISLKQILLGDLLSIADNKLVPLLGIPVMT